MKNHLNKTFQSNKNFVKIIKGFVLTASRSMDFIRVYGTKNQPIQGKIDPMEIILMTQINEPINGVPYLDYGYR